MRRVVGAVVVVATCIAGCGQGSTNTDRAAQALSPKIAQIRTAAQARQPMLARTRLAELRTQVESLHQQRVLSDVATARILAAATAVEQQLNPTVSSSPPTTASTTPSTTVRSAPSGKSDHKDKGHGQGNGN
jgi:hypothetical protein